MIYSALVVSCHAALLSHVLAFVPHTGLYLFQLHSNLEAVMSTITSHACKILKMIYFEPQIKVLRICISIKATQALMFCVIAGFIPSCRNITESSFLLVQGNISIRKYISPPSPCVSCLFLLSVCKHKCTLIHTNAWAIMHT